MIGARVEVRSFPARGGPPTWQSGTIVGPYSDTRYRAGTCWLVRLDAPVGSFDEVAVSPSDYRHLPEERDTRTLTRQCQDGLIAAEKARLDRVIWGGK